MDKFSDFLSAKLMPIGDRINRVKFLQVIRNAMMPLVPFIIIGSITLIILNFPYIDKVVPKTIMDQLGLILNPLSAATISMVALLLSYLMGFQYATISLRQEKPDVSNSTIPMYTGLVTLIAFVIVVPSSLKVGKALVGNVIPRDYLGSSGMFVALLLGYLVAALYWKLFHTNMKIKLPDSVPPAVMSSFETIIPGFLTLIIVSIINYALGLTSFGTLQNLINTILQQPLMHIGTGLPAILITGFLAQLFWFFGIHGDQIVGSVMDPILTTAGLKNLNAYQHGKALPYIYTLEFKNLFVMIAFMSLVIAIVISARSSYLKGLGKVMVGPAVFCISEPVVFGLPVVMNVTIFIPWVLSRPVFGLIAYLFMKFGWCPYPTGVSLPWTTPPILSGFLATNSIMGAVLQIILLAVGVLMFLPFVKVLDKMHIEEEVAQPVQEESK